MLSKYFEKKTETADFENLVNDILAELAMKKVLLYGAGEGFVALNQKYDFLSKLNVVAIADKKFEDKKETGFCSIKAIAPNEILDIDFDMILVTNENSLPIVNFLNSELSISSQKIRTLFVEKIADERVNLNYLYTQNFDKTLPKLKRKLKNKKVMFYGAGVFLELIKEYFDISDLNVIGVADKKYEICKNEEDFLGYKTYAPSEIEGAAPDYVIVSAKMYIGIMEELYYDILEKTKIKIKPLVKKSLKTLVKEIWNF